MRTDTHTDKRRRHRHMETSTPTKEDVGVAHDDHAQRAGDLHGVGLGHVRSVGEEAAGCFIGVCVVYVFWGAWIEGRSS